jgi:hypothetical protein
VSAGRVRVMVGVPRLGKTTRPIVGIAIMSASIANRHFMLRRSHSLVGLVPVGAFPVFHL